MNAIPFIGLFIWLLVAAAPVGAVEVKGLYEAEVPVADRSAPARHAALAAALGEVLLKVSGDSVVLGDATLTAEADRLIQEYRYREQPPVADTPPQLALWVQFDPAAVDQRLRSNGIPIWGAVRPLTLAWIAVDRGGQRTLIGANDGGDTMRAALEWESARWSLPLRLPLLDLSDRSRVDVTDIWGGFFQSVLEVSHRYEPQSVLIGRVHRVGSLRWRARWDLLLGEEHWQWEAEGDRPDVLVADGVGGSAQRLAQHFALSLASQGSERLRLSVSAVHDLGGFYRLLDYLGALHGVKGVQLEALNGDTAVLRLDIDGAAEAIVQTLALGDTLVREAQAVAEPPGNEGLAYRLLP